MKQHDIDLDLSRPQVMAILNVTPDSFFAGSRMPDATHVERRVKEAAAEGASIIDVGGYSSRPGADEVPADEEWRRVELGIGAVRRLAPGVLISVDTFRSEVAARAIEKFGPLIINDISAGELDPQMPATAARCGVPYVAMHMKGDPRTMQTLTDYKRDITAEVTAYFETKTADLLAAGIKRENIILDPGFGFAKTTEQNYELLAGLHCLCALGYPVLAGLSRKSMIYRVLDAPPNRSRAPSPSAGSACVRGPRSCACTMCRRPSIRSGSSTHTNGTANNHRNRMIKVTDIHKRFGDLEVLKGVSLDVAEGEVVSIVGASGAGKTTLLQIVGTLSRPDAGRVEIDGQDAFSLGDKALSRFRNERIGFVFQFHHLLPEFTAFENVCIPGFIGRRPRAEVERRAAELLEMMNLTPRRGHKPGQLSGGEQQRVAIARALVNSPAVLLADEPSGNLDSHNRDEIHRLFFELRDRLGQTVVIVTHDEHLAAMADRKITMSDGRIL